MNMDNELGIVLIVVGVLTFLFAKYIEKFAAEVHRELPLFQESPADLNRIVGVFAVAGGVLILIFA